MKIGMIGLGKMGANMTERLLKGGHEVVAYDLSADALETGGVEGRRDGDDARAELAQKLSPPRAAWVMVPAGKPTNDTIDALAGLFEKGDVDRRRRQLQLQRGRGHRRAAEEEGCRVRRRRARRAACGA